MNLIITEEDKTERVIEAVRVGAVVYALRLKQPALATPRAAPAAADTPRGYPPLSP